MSRWEIDEMSRWARFGVDQDGIKYIPVGGTCLMSYVISRKDDKILVGMIDGNKYADYWRDKWGMYVHRTSIWKDKWFVPSGFLRFGEEPSRCAERLVVDLLKGKADSIKLNRVISFTQRSKYYTGYNHWHICFVYDVEGLNIDNTPEWFTILKHVSPEELAADKIGIAGARVLHELGYLKG